VTGSPFNQSINDGAAISLLLHDNAIKPIFKKAESVLLIGPGASTDEMIQMIESCDRLTHFYVVDKDPRAFDNLSSVFDLAHEQGIDVETIESDISLFSKKTEQRFDLIYDMNVFDPNYFSEDALHSAICSVESLLKPKGYHISIPYQEVREIHQLRGLLSVKSFFENAVIYRNVSKFSA
jgi:hypothetical protein